MPDLAELVRTTGPSVVGLGRGARGGSGVVVAQDRALTLAHHLRGEEVEVVLAGERRERARVLGTDGHLGLALLDVPTGDAPGVRWAGDAATPPIGTPVAALADPGGTGLRVTAGALASGPTTVRGRGGRTVEGVLEHTAPLPRGSGAGPLTTLDGAVLGLNVLRQPGGFILAYPAHAVQHALEGLLAGRSGETPRLGVAIVPPRASRRMRRSVGLEDRDGLLVRGVGDETPAAAAGVRRGDLIVGVGGQPTPTVDALHDALAAAAAAARPVPLAVVRGEREESLELSLGEPA